MKMLETQEIYMGEVLGENFEIVRFGKLYGSQSEKVFAVVRFRNPNFGLDTEVEIPMADLGSRSLKSYIPEAFVLEGVPIERQYKEIAERLHRAMAHAIPYTILPQGFSHIEDEWFYAMGDIIIGDDRRQYYPRNPQNIHMDGLLQCSAEEYVSWCKLFINQGSDKAALFLGALVPYLRPITDAFNLSARVANIYVHGDTGCGKTEFCKLLLKLSDTHTIGVNLASDKSSILAAMPYYKDRCMLLDDWNKSSAVRESEKKITRLSESIQMSSSGGDVLVKNQKVDNENTGLLITAELLLDNCSSRNRTVIVGFQKTFDETALSQLQTNQYLFRSFLVKFVEWICRNHKALIDEVRDAWDKGMLDIRFAHDDSSAYMGFHRVMTSYRLLEISRYVVMRYFQHVLFKRMEKTSRKLEQGIIDSISSTLDLLKRESEWSPIARIIAEVFAADPDMIVTDEPKKYFKDPQKVFLRYDDRIYVRAEHLIQYLEYRLKVSITSQELSMELTKLGVLIITREKTTKLPVDLRKFSKKRYYRMDVRAVCDFTESIFPDALSRTRSPLYELNPFD